MGKKKTQEVNEKELENVSAGWDVPLPTIHPCPYCGELLDYAFIESRNVRDGCSTKTEYKCFTCGKWF